MTPSSFLVLPPRRRVIWRAAFLIVVLLLLAQSLRVINLDKQQRDTHDEVQGLLAEARMRSLQEDLVATSAVAELEHRAPEGWGDAEKIASRLREDLARRSELIPAPATLGGTMHFRRDDIHVLNDRWVLAGYEDGHVAGWGLYEFNFGADAVEWTLIKSTNGAN